MNRYFSIDSFCRYSCSNLWGYPGTCEESWYHFAETISGDFFDDRESSYSVCRGQRNMSTKWVFVFYMDMCSPNTIDIASEFSINQGSTVFDLGPVFLCWFLCSPHLVEIPVARPVHFVEKTLCPSTICMGTTPPREFQGFQGGWKEYELPGSDVSLLFFSWSSKHFPLSLGDLQLISIQKNIKRTFHQHVRSFRKCPLFRPLLNSSKDWAIQQYGTS